MVVAKPPHGRVCFDAIKPTVCLGLDSGQYYYVIIENDEVSLGMTASDLHFLTIHRHLDEIRSIGIL